MIGSTRLRVHVSDCLACQNLFVAYTFLSSYLGLISPYSQSLVNTGIVSRGHSTVTVLPPSYAVPSIPFH